MKVLPVEVSSAAIRKTLALLRRAGLRESVLLWLGREDAETQRIIEVYRPIQHGAVDYFEIPRKGMVALMDRLRTQGLRVVSQVHTHPKEAFHSLADDKWAIVRHVGALSIVVPNFARSINPDNFLHEAAVYRLDASNRWNRVAQELLPNELWIRS